MAEVKTKEGTKFTTKEMEKVSKIKNSYNEITIRLGQIELDRILLDGQRKELDKEYLDTREQEIQYAKELSDKYGIGSLDLETGVFIPNE